MRRLLLSLAVLASLTGAAHADPPRKMNVLFIAVDDLEPALACAGRGGFTSWWVPHSASRPQQPAQPRSEATCPKALASPHP